MKLRTILAGLSAAAIAVSGLMLGGTAAMAAPAPFPGGGYVPVWDIANNDPVADYNLWHFDPDAAPDVPAGDYLAQYTNGFVVPGGDKVLAMLGNGNDAAKTDAAHVPTGPDIATIAATISVTSSNQAGVAYQIPVFFNNTGVAPAISWKFTTLRKTASDATDNNWISSRAITGPNLSVAPNVETPLADILDALEDAGDDARPIGAGFMVDSTSDVLVSSFSVNGEKTRFYYQQWIDPIQDSVTEFVHSDAIRPNEDTYPGWHQGVPADNAALGTFASIDAANGAVNGLRVEGKSQILFGNPYEASAYNNLPAILEAGVSMYGVPSADAAGYTFQVPIFYYTEGVVGQQFTTLRTEVPADGIITAGGDWTSSGANGMTASLADILGGMIDYRVIGHGFYIESGSVVAESVTFNGRTTNFTKAAVVPAGPQGIANTGAGDNMAPMVGIAALALMALGGVTLAARRRLQG